MPLEDTCVSLHPHDYELFEVDGVVGADARVGDC